MTSRKPTALSLSAHHAAALVFALLVAACGDRAIAPDAAAYEKLGAATAAGRNDHNDFDDEDDDDDHDDCDRPHHHHHGGNGGNSCSRSKVSVSVTTAVQTLGAATVGIAATHPNGAEVEKIKVKLYNERGKRVAELEFKKIPNNTGITTVTIPAKYGVKPGWKAKVTVYVETCKGKTKRIVLRRVTFGAPVPPPAAPDLDAADIMFAAPIPTNDTPLHDVDVGVATQYDVAVTNAPNSTAVTASCKVTVDGVPLPASAVFWVDVNGNQLGSNGSNLLIPSNGLSYCRFSTTFATAGAHTVAVTISAVGGGETNLTNNTATASIGALPPGNDPLVKFEWNIRQRDTVTWSIVNGLDNVVSHGLLNQTATISTHWVETTTNVAGTDSWTFDLSSGTLGGSVDARAGTISLPRITQAMIEASPSGTACQTVGPSAASAVRAYLTTTVQVCAALDLGDPSKTNMRLDYIINSAAFTSDAPYTGSDLLLWGSEFSFTGVITHTGASGTNTYGGVTKTVTLPPGVFLISDPFSGLPTLGPQIRLLSFSQAAQ